MADNLTDEERRLIAEALAEGKVKKVKRGVSSIPVYTYDKQTQKLILKDEKLRVAWGRKNRVDPRVTARRKQVLERIRNGAQVDELAKEFGISPTAVRYDIRVLRQQGHIVELKKPVDEAAKNRVDMVTELVPVCESLNQIAIIVGVDRRQLKADFDKFNKGKEYGRLLKRLAKNRDRDPEKRPLAQIETMRMQDVSIQTISRRLKIRHALVRRITYRLKI